MKAFVSYHLNDREFVEEVVRQLKKLNCILEVHPFQSEKDFESSIINGFDRNTMPVFFVGQDFFDILWKKPSDSDAFFAKLTPAISSLLVCNFIGENSQYRFPEWIQKAIFKSETSPSAIARDIRINLLSSNNLGEPLFLGRAKERESIENILNPIDGSSPPNCFGVFGLPGVGRRSFIKNFSKDLLSLRKTVEITLEVGDQVTDLCIKFADLIEPYSCQDELKEIVNNIKSLSEEDCISRIVLDAKKILSTGELPIIIDAGGMINENGTLRYFVNNLLKAISDENGLTLACVFERRVSRDNEISIECAYIEPLSEKAVKQLLFKLAEKRKLTLTLEEINSLSKYINGYPPAAIFAIHQASIYGIETLLSDKKCFNTV